MKDDNQKAINNGKMYVNDGVCGLTKREYFAGLALQGLLANDGKQLGVVESAVRIADKLLLALEEN